MSDLFLHILRRIVLAYDLSRIIGMSKFLHVTR